MGQELGLEAHGSMWKMRQQRFFAAQLLIGSVLTFLLTWLSLAMLIMQLLLNSLDIYFRRAMCWDFDLHLGTIFWIGWEVLDG